MGSLFFIITLLVSSATTLSVRANPTNIAEETLMEAHPAVAAIDQDNSQVLQLWIQAGHTPLAKIKNLFHERLIDRAASHGSVRCFQVLFSSIHALNADNELQDSRGTPLLVTLSSLAMPGKPLTPAYEKMIAYALTQHPALVQSRDHAYIGDGRTALHQAAAVGNLRIMQLLLAKGAPINAKNSIGETPLHFAARFGHLDAVKYLVANAAFINEKTNFTHTTPLMAAAETGNENIIRFLMLSGAERDARDVFGKTAPERYQEFRLASNSTQARKKALR